MICAETTFESMLFRFFQRIHSQLIDKQLNTAKNTPVLGGIRTHSFLASLRRYCRWKGLKKNKSGEQTGEHFLCSFFAHRFRWETQKLLD
jgi:hypothetical protein